MPKGVKAKLKALDEQNRTAARIIAGNPARYSGIMREWAAAILAKAMRLRDPHWNSRTSTGGGRG